VKPTIHLFEGLILNIYDLRPGPVSANILKHLNSINWYLTWVYVGASERRLP
jgi:hypothetical protein